MREHASGALRKLAKLVGRDGRKERRRKKRKRGRKEGRKEEKERERETTHPRIAHGQRYPMPCLE